MQRYPQSDRTGVLVARAWHDGPADEIRVRLTWSADVVDDQEPETAHQAVTGTVEEVIVVVRAWLARIGAADRGRSLRRTSVQTAARRKPWHYCRGIDT